MFRVIWQIDMTWQNLTDWCKIVVRGGRRLQKILACDFVECICRLGTARMSALPWSSNAWKKESRGVADPLQPCTFLSAVFPLTCSYAQCSQRLRMTSHNVALLGLCRWSFDGFSTCLTILIMLLPSDDLVVPDIWTAAYCDSNLPGGLRACKPVWIQWKTLSSLIPILQPSRLPEGFELKLKEQDECFQSLWNRWDFGEIGWQEPVFGWHRNWKGPWFPVNFKALMLRLKLSADLSLQFELQGFTLHCAKIATVVRVFPKVKAGPWMQW